MPGSLGVVHDWKRTFTDTVNTSDSDTKAISQAHSDTLNLTDTDTKAIGYILTDTTNLTDTDAKSIGYVLTDTTNITDLKTCDWDITKVLTETLNTTDSHIRKRYLYLSDTMNITDVKDPWVIGKGFTETINATDTLTSKWDMERAFTETINTLDDIFTIKYDQTKIDIFVTDFTNVLDDIPDEDVTLRKATYTTDSLGNPVTVTDTDVTINGRFWSTSLKERKLIEGGLSVVGFLTGYFEPSYTVSTVDYSVEEGDAIIKDSILYRVVTIEKIHQMETTEIFVKAILRREG